MKTNHNYYVYIVECKDGSYYTGVTNDIGHRLWQHNTGIDKECYTYTRRPVELRYLQHFQQVEEAIKWEKQLKGWSRKKKQALFREDWEEIKQLAKSSMPSSNSGDPSPSSG
jgi:putative endonuclease